jgi:hypothetical protein
LLQVGSYPAHIPHQADAVAEHSSESMVDLYRIRSDGELKKRLARKKKKSKSDETSVALEMADELVHGGCLKAQGKVRVDVHACCCW